MDFDLISTIVEAVQAIDALGYFGRSASPPPTKRSRLVVREQSPPPTTPLCRTPSPVREPTHDRDSSPELTPIKVPKRRRPRTRQAAVDAFLAIREQSRWLRLWKKEAKVKKDSAKRSSETETPDSNDDEEEGWADQADFHVEKSSIVLIGRRRPRGSSTWTTVHVLKKRVVAGRRELLIKWVGDDQPTWEPYENADGCPDRLGEFLREDDDGFEEDEGEFDSD